MRRLACAFAAFIAALAGSDAQAQDPAQDDEGPDLEFLEYLGSWAADDEDWFVDAEIQKAEESDRKTDEETKQEKDRAKDDVADAASQSDTKDRRRNDENE